MTGSDADQAGAQITPTDTVPGVPKGAQPQPSHPAAAQEFSRIYWELLGRAPTPEEDRVQSGRSAVDVALEVSHSDEFRRRIRSVGEDDVRRLYREFLGREPESSQVVAARMGRSPIDVAVEIGRSEEAARKLFLRPENLAQLQRVLAPASPAPQQWFQEYARIIRVHGIDPFAVFGYLHRMGLHEAGLRVENQELLSSLQGSGRRLRNFGSKVTLVVPTVDSEHFIEHVINFYAGLGVPVLFAVDRRTRDRTRCVIARKGAVAIEAAGDDPRVEALIADIVTQVGTEWILRLDDDELPTPAMLEFVDQAVEGPTGFAWGFPRAHLRYEATCGQLQYSQFPLDDSDRQFRLFALAGFEPDQQLHSSGFVAKERRAARPDAFLLHFDWVLRSFAERLQKLQAYERQDRARARALSHIKLYESVPESWHMFMPLPDDRYRNMAERLNRLQDPARAAAPQPLPAPQIARSQDPDFRPVFRGLWLGDGLSPLHRACLQSFVKRGWSFELYTYGPLDAGPGIELRDAAEIISEDQIFYFSDPLTGGRDIGPFSDLFRAKLLLDKGGWWCDVDTICLSNEIPHLRYAWSREWPLSDPNEVSNGLIACPAGDPLMQELHNRCRAAAAESLTWRQQLGNRIFSSCLVDLHLPLDMSGSYEVFCPLVWVETFKMWLPDFTEELSERISSSYFIHVYCTMAKVIGIDLSVLPPAGSFLDKVFQKFGDATDRDRPRYDSGTVKGMVRRYFLEDPSRIGWLRLASREDVLEKLELPAV